MTEDEVVGIWGKWEMRTEMRSEYLKGRESSKPRFKQILY